MNRPLPFGKYILLERISVGGMAEVFKGRTFGIEGFARFVAIKRILPQLAEDSRFVDMFIDEAKMAAQLNHANIAQVIELGREQADHFIAMEYVAGKDLLALFLHLRKKRQRLPVHLVAFIGHQVAEGLDYAHRKRGQDGRPLGIVHRDVSPQNVLVSYDGAVKLIDFGIAKVRKQGYEATRAGVLKGKFGYMSPELIEARPVDLRSDIFSLGTVLWELLCTERLFTGDNEFITLEKVRAAEVDPPSLRNDAVPAELDRILLRALAREPEARYQYASELADDLARFLHSIGHSPSTKEMGQWMRSEFSQDLDEERRKAQAHARISLGADGRVVQATEEEEEPTALWQPDADTADDWARATAPPDDLEPPPDPMAMLGRADAGRSDAGRSDAGRSEAGRSEAGRSEAGRSEAGRSEAGRRDAGRGDAVRADVVPARTAERPLTERPTDPLPLTQRPTEIQARLPAPERRRGRGALLAAVVVGLLLTSVAGWWLLRSPAASLVVHVNPPDSLVIRVGGRMVGEAAPLRLEGLAAGSVVLEVVREGFAPFQRTVELEAGETTAVDVNLALELASEADLRFSVTPAGARITVDGKPVRDGRAQVQAGRRVAIRIEADGFLPFEGTVTPERGEVPLTYVLAPRPASLFVDSKPPGMVLVNGRRRGRSPVTIADLDPDKPCLVRIEAPDHLPYEKTVTFGPERHATVDAQLTPQPK